MYNVQLYSYNIYYYYYYYLGLQRPFRLNRSTDNEARGVRCPHNAVKIYILSYRGHVHYIIIINCGATLQFIQSDSLITKQQSFSRGKCNYLFFEFFFTHSQ